MGSSFNLSKFTDMKIANVLKEVDKVLNKTQPKTMDQLIETVHGVAGMCAYGTSFHIVKYMGYLQGVRVYVTGRSRSHVLPAPGKVYSVFQGIEKYEKAGFPVEYD